MNCLKKSFPFFFGGGGGDLIKKKWDLDGHRISN